MGWAARREHVGGVVRQRIRADLDKVGALAGSPTHLDVRVTLGKLDSNMAGNETSSASDQDGSRLVAVGNHGGWRASAHDWAARARSKLRAWE